MIFFFYKLEIRYSSNLSSKSKEKKFLTCLERVCMAGRRTVSSQWTCATNQNSGIIRIAVIIRIYALRNTVKAYSHE